MPSKLDPASFARAIIVESADIPEHMTISEWRKARTTARKHRRRSPRRRRPRRVTGS
jgi:hypothetical protein